MIQPSENSWKLMRGMVAEFIQKFGASLDPRFWLTLIAEEHKELSEALDQDDKHQILKEAMDLYYVQVGFILTSAAAEQLNLFSDTERGDIFQTLQNTSSLYEQAMEKLGDLNYFEAFRRVHLSNMSKLGDDGFPVYREDGKVLKGASYVPPKFSDLLKGK
jgi:hypothetical protein